MKTLDKAMYWIENNTNLFINILVGVVWCTVIYSIHLSLNEP